MKLLSVRQPWAALLLNGQKTIETRTWATKYRGRLGVHAGLQLDRYGPLHRFPDPSLLLRGAVIGAVELVDCRPMTAADADAALCHFRPGLFAWVVRNGAFFPHPVPTKGKLGLWEGDI